MAAQAEAMLRRLAAWPVLAGVRGRPPADVAAAAEALSRLSWLAHDAGARLVELDVNPLILRPAGGGAIAVDGRATLRRGCGSDDARGDAEAATLSPGDGATR